MYKPGDILRYFYVWRRQADQGEESGRKARPVCLVVKTSANPSWLYFFPLTTQPPQTQANIPIPEIECRRIGLSFPTWLIIDEYNFVEADKNFDLATVQPLGSFSPPFFRIVAIGIRERAAARQLRGVRRS